MKTDKFLQAYIECALWSSTDENEEPLDRNYSASDIAPSTLLQMEQDCQSFKDVCTDQNLDWCPEGEERAGHDFWLTRNHHGAGFWDRGLGELGAALTEWAHAEGSADLYVGDDGLIYQS